MSRFFSFCIHENTRTLVTRPSTNASRKTPEVDTASLPLLLFNQYDLTHGSF